MWSKPKSNKSTFSAFRNFLIDVYSNFLQALASPSQRRNLLQELFADIALEVDDRAKG